VALVGKEPGPLLQGRTHEKRNGQRRQVFPSDHRGVVFSFAAVV